MSRLHPCGSCSDVTFTRLRVDTGGFVCGICAHQLYDQCSQCERYALHSRYVVGNQRACPACAQLQRACQDCGTLISARRGCDRCADPHALWNYSYRPDPIFHGTGPLFLGLELEVIVPDDRFDDAITTATDALGSLGYLKRDSSIRPSGFEIVSHLLLRGHHPWSAITYTLGTVIAGMVATAVGIALGTWMTSWRGEEQN